MDHRKKKNDIWIKCIKQTRRKKRGRSLIIVELFCVRSHLGTLSLEHPYDLSITLSFIIRGNWSSERLKFAPKSCHYWGTEVKFKQRLAHDALTTYY